MSGPAHVHAAQHVSADDARLVVDGRDRIVGAGDRATALLGQARPGIIGRTPADLVVPADADPVRRHLLEARGDALTARVRPVSPGMPWTLVSFRSVGAGDDGTRTVEVAEVRFAPNTADSGPHNSRLLAHMVAMSSEPVVVLDDEGTIVWVSASVTGALGWLPDELVGMSAFEFIHPDDSDRLVGELISLVSQGRTGDASAARVIDVGGSVVRMQLTATDAVTGWIGPDGRTSTVFAVWMHDATHRQIAMDDVRQREAQLRLVLGATSDVTILLDDRLTVLWASPSIERLLGLPARSVVSSGLVGLVEPDDAGEIIAAGRKVLGGESHVPTSVRFITAAGERVWVELVMARAEGSTGAGSIVISARDVTVRRSLESRLAQAATRDLLTGLWNRSYIIAGLDESLAALSAGGVGSLAVVFVDLDRFKDINDIRGHLVGDEVLVQLGARLRALCGPDDLVGRLGGDEFVIVRPSVAASDGMDDLLDRLGEAFGFPFKVGELELAVTGSIGMFEVDARRAGELDAMEVLRNVDIAMYRAKESGRDRVVRFDEEMRRSVLERLELEAYLRQAVLRRELIIHFQPVIDLSDGRWIGLEALVRWMHPTLGMLPPGNFIAVAEESGLVGQVGDWVIEEAVRALAQWRATFTGAEPLWISVNVSAQQINDEAFVPFVASTLQRHSLPPDCLVVELTERTIVSRRDATVRAIERLVDLGVHLAIDDFGTGHSSLSHLHSLPVELVKIDGSFVATILDSPRDRLIVSAIVDLCRGLGIATVAEGLERIEQIAALRDLGCAGAQGYLFDRPLPMSEIIGRFLQAAGMAFETRAIGRGPQR